MEDFVTFEIAKKLKEKGFDEGCEFTFYNNYRVRDEIYEKHPGLTDDGYEDLRKNYGGPYKDKELYGYYIEPLKLYSRNSTIGINPITKQKVATSELCSCPNIYQVMKWLREEKRIDTGAVWDNRDGKWVGYINEMDMPDLVGEYVLPNIYDLYEQAVVAGIECAINNLI